MSSPSRYSFASGLLHTGHLESITAPTSTLTHEIHVTCLCKEGYQLQDITKERELDLVYTPPRLRRTLDNSPLKVRLLRGRAVQTPAPPLRSRRGSGRTKPSHQAKEVRAWRETGSRSKQPGLEHFRGLAAASNGCRPASPQRANQPAFTWFSLKENHTSLLLPDHSHCENALRHRAPESELDLLAKFWTALGSSTLLLGSPKPHSCKQEQKVLWEYKIRF